MKRILTVAILLLPSALVANDEVVGDSWKSSWCPFYGTVAEDQMTRRQALTTTLSESMTFIGDMDGDETIKQVLKQIALDAFSHPVADSEEQQVRTIVEFRNKWELDCYNTADQVQ